MISIHVGLHKTGSSSIQAALRHARHRRGLTVAVPGDPIDWRIGPLGNWVREHSTTGRVVVSHEGLLGSHEDGYSGAVGVADRLAASLTGLDWQLIVFLRPQYEWLPSVYLQHLHEGGSSDPETFWVRYRQFQLLHWCELVRELRAAVAPAVVKVCALEGGADAVSAFFDLADEGAPPRIESGGFRENVSITAPQAPILRLLNEGCEGDPVAQSTVRAFFQTRLGATAKSGSSPFPREVQLEVLDTYREDWARLRDVVTMDVGGMVWPTSPKPFAGDSLADPEVSAEVARALLRALDQGNELQPGIVSRALRKARDHPGDLIPAIIRRAHRST